MKRSGVVIVIIVILGIMPLTSSFSHNVDILVEGKENNVPAQIGSLEEHEPIEILNNEDFETQGWPGNGTPKNPYLIEGFEIRSDTSGILIRQSTVHFEIRNCIISGNDEGDSPGIFLSDLSNGMVKNCVVQDHVIGFYTSHCTNCSVFNNTAKDNRIVGFHVYWTRNCLIENNTALGESRYGFQLSECEACSFVNNNVINSSNYGLYLDTSRNCSIFNNTFTGCGLRVYGWDLSSWMHSISGNTVNGKPLLYLKNAKGTTIDSSYYGQVILANCTGVTVANGTFTQGSGGIWIMRCLDCSVIGNMANLSYSGFTVQSSDRCILANNTVRNTSDYGFELWYSGNCTVSNNSVIGSSIGFSMFGAGNNTLENNMAKENGVGFEVSASYENVFVENVIEENKEGFSLYKSIACTLRNNTFFDDALSIQGNTENYWQHSILGNAIDGSPLGYFLKENDSIIDANQYGQIIVVSANETTISGGAVQNNLKGITLAYSDNCRLVNVTVAGSQSTGYSLYSCANCTIENCTAIQNTRHGIHSVYSPSCEFTSNNVSNNSGHGFFLVDSGKSLIVSCEIRANSEQGMKIVNSPHCTVKNNRFENNSLMMSGIGESWMHNISGNTINGAQLGYFREVTNSVFDADEFGQLILVDCHDVIVEEGILNRTSGGIQLVYCTQVRITRVTVIGSSSHAFFLYDTISATLSDNVATDCKGDGFALEYGRGCSFLSNIARRNDGDGYALGLPTNCVLADNMALDNAESGFVLMGAESCTVDGNSASRNSNDGFDIDASESTITRNEAHGNARDGLCLSISESTITKNVLTQNGRHGIMIQEFSYRNTFFLNRIGFNNDADALNNGQANSWDNGVFGNYWGEYDGSGVYLVPGIDASVDSHPYEYYHAPPVIDHPDDISYVYNASGYSESHSIKWNAWDWDSTTYRIWRDSELVSGGTLYGSRITHDVSSALTPATYNYTVVVSDQQGNSVSDTVFVTIEYPSDYTPGLLDLINKHLALMIIGAASAIVVIAVLAAEYFEKIN